MRILQTYHLLYHIQYIFLTYQIPINIIFIYYNTNLAGYFFLFFSSLARTAFDKSILQRSIIKRNKIIIIIYLQSVLNISEHQKFLLQHVYIPLLSYLLYCLLSIEIFHKALLLHQPNMY